MIEGVIMNNSVGTNFDNNNINNNSSNGVDINELEMMRKEAVNRVILSIVISIIVMVGATFLFKGFNYFMLIICVIFCIFFSSGKISKFKRRYK